jgi:Tfp pilus assembly PilM family ATPase
MPPVFLSPVVTILRCGADRATKGVFRRQSGRLRCEEHQTVEFPAGIAGANDWVEPACAAIRALRPANSGKNTAVLVLPPQATLLKHLRIPRVDAPKRARLVAFEAGQNIPGGLDDVVWDSMLSGEGEGTHDVLLVAAKLRLIEPLCAAARATGFAVQRIVPSALAILGAGRLARPVQMEPELLLHVEAGAATLLQLAGRDFAARSLLLGRLATGGMEELVAHLVPDITRSLLHFQRQCGLPAPVRLVLAGGANSPEIGPALAQRLAIPVQRMEAGAMITFAAGTGSGDNPCHLTELIGAATMSLRPAQVELNLLPPGLRTQQRRRRRQPWLIAVALLALATPLAPLVHFHRLARMAAASSAELDGILAPLRVYEARNRSNLAQLVELERQISAWRTVRERRAGWLEFLADLQERLSGVEDVWLDRMRLVPAAKDGPMKLTVAGRLLERGDPSGQSGGPEVYDRVRALLASLRQSPFIGAIEEERFDGSQPGLLSFEFVLLGSETRPL